MRKAVPDYAALAGACEEGRADELAVRGTSMRWRAGPALDGLVKTVGN